MNKASKSIISIQELCLTKNKKKLLDNISFEVPENSIFSMIGPNGAGKTTTINCILGISKFDKGKIKIFGKNLDQESIKSIGYSPDEAIYYEYLTGLEHMVFFGKLSGLSGQESKIEGINLLKKLGLETAINKQIKNYSKGMKQRLGLATSLINDPNILIRDEPMNGLDPIGRKLIKDLIKQLQKKGKTIFFSIHILSDVQDLSDYFIIIDNGNIIFQQKTSSLKTPIEKLFLEKIKKK